MSSIVLMPNLPLALPERQIRSRLGHAAETTRLEPEQAAFLQEKMRLAFALVKAQGLYRCLDILSNDGESLLLAEQSRIYSRDLAKMLRDSQQVWLAAVTIGPSLGEQSAELFAQGQAAAAAVYDAVGSECADASMDFLQEYAGTQLRRSARSLSKFRFSPGYGDWDIAVQPLVAAALDTVRKAGLCVTDTNLMTPRKSVTALLGVSDHPVKGQLAGCGHCVLRTRCEYRKRGKTCASE